jgi:hypothetical protein
MQQVLVALAVFVAIILVAVLGFKLYDYIVAYDFYTNSEVAFATPGVNNSDFVPQGMDYVEDDKVFIFTGYMSDSTASRVYVRHEDGTLTHTQLVYNDGRPYNEHTGGIECYGDYIFITDTTGIFIFSYSDILEGKETTPVLCEASLHVDPAHCFIYSNDGKDYLLAGSFFYEGSYDTPPQERIPTPAGETNPSIILIYPLNPDATKASEVIAEEPIAGLSTPQKVQGMCFTDDGKMVISTSWSITPSEILFYDEAKIEASKVEAYQFKGATKKGEEFDLTVDLYFADSSNYVGKVVAPPMSEELVYLDGKIYVFNESACNKYIFGKLTTGFNLYAYDYSTFNK